LNAPSIELPAGEGGDRPVTVAANDDFRPESQGIFRLFRNEPAVSPDAVSASAEITASASDPAIPLPRQRPAAVKRGGEDKVALAAPGL
jgi:hypothetical protein